MFEQNGWSLAFHLANDKWRGNSAVTVVAVEAMKDSELSSEEVTRIVNRASTLQSANLPGLIRINDFFIKERRCIYIVEERTGPLKIRESLPSAKTAVELALTLCDMLIFLRELAVVPPPLTQNMLRISEERRQVVVADVEVLCLLQTLTNHNNKPESKAERKVSDDARAHVDSLKATECLISFAGLIRVFAERFKFEPHESLASILAILEDPHSGRKYQSALHRTRGELKKISDRLKRQ